MRKAEKTRVKEDVAKKKEIIFEVASTSKSLGIKMESSESTTETEEKIDLSYTNVFCPEAEASISNKKTSVGATLGKLPEVRAN